MRRTRNALLAATAALLLLTASAQAAIPTLGPVSANDIQGVSVLLKGTVDPEDLPTTYGFQYVDQAAFAGSGFATATKTSTASVGPGSSVHPARAAISGLAPDTTYHYRLVAANASGSATADGVFTTTHGFGFLPGSEGFGARAIADGGGPAIMAGSHPYQLNFDVGLNLGGEFEGQPGVAFSDGDLRNLRIELPPGLILNPAVVPTCTAVAFGVPRSSPFAASFSGESCPDRAQLGTLEVQTSLGGGQVRRFGIFNLDPPPGIPAQLGAAPFGIPIVFDTQFRIGADGSYAFTLRADNVPQRLDLSGLKLMLWGTPWGASHNGERGNCLNEAQPEFPWTKCSVGPPAINRPLAYLSMPTACTGSISFSAAASSWQQPAVVSRGAVNRDSLGQPAELDSCTALRFDFFSSGLLTDRKASSPSGFNFQLRNDNETLTDPDQPASPPTKKAVVALPPGVSLNPSVGAGLGTCNPAQYAAETAFSVPGTGCPDAAKIGDFSVRSPLFEALFEGSIFLATPDDPRTTAAAAENPFDSLIAVYLVATLPERGVAIRLAGRIVPDPANGNLTATFEGLPQLPYTDLNVNFRTGQRAFLITPPACGPATTRIEMNPWAAELAATNAISSSAIETGVGGGPCPPPGAPPFAPGAVAGAVNSNVGSYTPYFIHLSRQDNEQEITSYSLVLPKGITAKLAGIPFCGEAAIAAARTRGGVAETASPSCPAASEVGHTLTGYGVGSALTYAPGRVYLAGPYNGQPLSLVTINAATVGPFDLGTIVIRSAFSIDPRTAQLRIDSRSSDPIPHIVDGIPLHLRDIRIFMDRPEFTHNPSSCAPSELISTLTGSGARFGDSGDDSVVTVSRHFQLLNCLTLGFRPKLGLRLRGGSRRGDHPSLRATFAARGPRDSNLKGIAVTMPHSLFLAQEHIKGICTRVQFAEERCPARSEYGKAVAHTPLFDAPLRGPVYLRASANKLPDLVASLRSGSISITLEGKIGPSKQGGIRTLFEGLPDAPIDRFTLTLFGGRRGLLVNSANICANPPIASVKALGQNDVGAIFTTKLRGQCKAKKKHSKGGKR